MKKITDFIVEKGNIILFIFITLSIFSLYLSTKVNINYDLTKYLPSTSETKIGMDIMDNEFSSKNSDLNIMFKDLTEEEKEIIYTDLSLNDGVISVMNDNTDDYNKDGYTLYELTVSDSEDSEVAKNLYNNLMEKYKDYNFEMSGGIASRNKPVLDIRIVAFAIICAMIILIIMCDSYIEPFLFLFVIGLAVFINKGTNIFFPSVSNITSSICAILQMALSMDYSIMLMNRYVQEKQKEKDKKIAMKTALYNSFASISSSSITTIVGLLALVFMSFTIGKDLGIVLAKGVILSLISIFFALPALILLFDDLIIKTKKKHLTLSMNKCANISYKFKRLSLILFILVLIGSFILKDNLKYEYTATESNKVAEVFTETNQMAIIYKNEDEDFISTYCRTLSKKDKFNNVLCYGNTINESLKYNELNQKLKDLGQDANIEEYLIKLIYFNYYNQSTSKKMTFNEFVSFITNDVYKNKDLSKDISKEMKEEINKLQNFTSSKEINKQRTAKEIASILGISSQDIESLYILYNSKNNNTKLTAPEFINFINNTVLKDDKCKSSIPKDYQSLLQQATPFTNKDNIAKKMTSKEMSSFTGIDYDTVNNLYNYYESLNPVTIKLTINEFVNFTLNDVITNPSYSNLFSKEIIQKLQMIKTFSNNQTISKKINYSEIASLFNLDKDSTKQLFLLYYLNIKTSHTYTLQDFIITVTNLKNNTTYLNDTDVSMLLKLYDLANNKNDINNTKLDKSSLKNIFEPLSKGLVDKIYLLSLKPSSYKYTPVEFVNHTINDFGNLISQEDKNSLNLLKLVMIDTTTKYDSSSISKLLGIKESDSIKLYSLIDYYKDNTKDWLTTPYEFVKFILDNKNLDELKAIDQNTFNELETLKLIMVSSLNNEIYDYNELSKLLNVDSNTLNKLFTLYQISNSSTTLTPYELVEFTLKHSNDNILKDNIDKDMLNKLNLVSTLMDAVKNNTKYNYNEISKTYGLNESDIKLLYSLYDTLNSGNKKISLKAFVSFVLSDVINDTKYNSNFDKDSISKLKAINNIMNSSLNNKKYNASEIVGMLNPLSKDLNRTLVDLLYLYYGSKSDYDNNWTLTVEQFIMYLNNDIITDSKFDDFLSDNLRNQIVSAKSTILDAKDLLKSNNYSRVVLNTKLDPESDETFNAIKDIKDSLSGYDTYLIGNSAMAYEMNNSFNDELNFITILTMLFIFAVVAFTFKSLIIPIILVLLIQCAVYITMDFLTLTGGHVYFIAILIVQSILMGATIDYAILFTSYYLESRKSLNVLESVTNSYNKSIHTILTSASILIIVTYVVGKFSSGISAKICTTISAGTLFSSLLMLTILPGILATLDRFIIKNR